MLLKKRQTRKVFFYMSLTSFLLLFFVVGCGYKQLNIFDNVSINKSSFRIIRWDGDSLNIYNFKGDDKEKKDLLDKLNKSEGKEIAVSHTKTLPIYALLLEDYGSSETSENAESVSYAVFTDNLLSLDPSCHYKTNIDINRIIEDFTYVKEEQPFYGANPYILYASRISPFYQFQRQNNSWNKEYLTKAYPFTSAENVSCILWQGNEKMSLNMKMTNSNDEIISAAEWFNVQVLLDEEWYVVPFRSDVIFPDYLENGQYDMIALEPGKEISCTFYLDDYYDNLPEGKYRISYGNIAAEFEVDASGTIIMR